MNAIYETKITFEKQIPENEWNKKANILNFNMNIITIAITGHKI